MISNGDKQPQCLKCGTPITQPTCPNCGFDAMRESLLSIDKASQNKDYYQNELAFFKKQRDKDQENHQKENDNKQLKRIRRMTEKQTQDEDTLQKDKNKSPQKPKVAVFIGLMGLLLLGFVFLISNTGIHFRARTPLVIKFGSYEQDGVLENGKESLTWNVYGIENGKALLVCNTGIEAIQFNKKGFNNTLTDSDLQNYQKTGDSSILGLDNSWTNSDLRKWLNNDFYNSAFSSVEKDIISETKITTGRLSDKEGHSPGETYGEDEVTTDNVFVPEFSEFWETPIELSVSEKAKSDLVNSFIRENYHPIFWTRSPYGRMENLVIGNNTEYTKWSYSVYLPFEYALVRPAIYVDIEALILAIIK